MMNETMLAGELVRTTRDYLDCSAAENVRKSDLLGLVIFMLCLCLSPLVKLPSRRGGEIIAARIVFSVFTSEPRHDTRRDDARTHDRKPRGALHLLAAWSSVVVQCVGSAAFCEPNRPLFVPPQPTPTPTPNHQPTTDYTIMGKTDESYYKRHARERVLPATTS